jgi:Iron only hydrogenase large subunit, C-terminal domain
VLRLLQIKFPDLLQHVAPVLTPMEVAARLAKEDAAKRTGVAYEEIGAFFISPCPAKVTEMRNPMSAKHSAVSGVIGAHLIYKDIIKYINHKDHDSGQTGNLQKATRSGMAWGYVTGESKSVDFGDHPRR